MTTYILIFALLFLVYGYWVIQEVKNDQSGNHRLSEVEHVQMQLDRFGRELLELSPHYRQGAIESMSRAIAMSRYLEKSMQGTWTNITASNSNTGFILESTSRTPEGDLL